MHTTSKNILSQAEDLTIFNLTNNTLYSDRTIFMKTGNFYFSSV